MLEVALSRTPTMKIGRDAEYPTAFVQQRFEQLTSTHIEKVLDAIQENTTRVRMLRCGKISQGNFVELTATPLFR